MIPCILPRPWMQGFGNDGTVLTVLRSGHGGRCWRYASDPDTRYSTTRRVWPRSTEEQRKGGDCHSVLIPVRLLADITTLTFTSRGWFFNVEMFCLPLCGFGCFYYLGSHWGYWLGFVFFWLVNSPMSWFVLSPRQYFRKSVLDPSNPGCFFYLPLMLNSRNHCTPFITYLLC